VCYQSVLDTLFGLVAAPTPICGPASRIQLLNLLAAALLGQAAALARTSAAVFGLFGGFDAGQL
jgi:hypothetical protein